MSASNYVHITECDVLAVSGKAIKFAIPQGDDVRWEWIPTSQLSDPDNYEVGDTGVTLTMTEWIAKQKGLEPDE